MNTDSAQGALPWESTSYSLPRSVLTPSGVRTGVCVSALDTKLSAQGKIGVVRRSKLAIDNIR